MVGRQQILSQLGDLITACDELFEEHGAECCCDGCCAVGNMVGTFRIFEMLLQIT